MKPAPDIATLRRYLQGEIDAAYIFGTLARSTRDGSVGAVFGRLAETEKRHALFWKTRLLASGAADPQPKPGVRARFLAWLARRFGAAAVLPYLARVEEIESHGYDGEPDAVAAGMPADEYGHARIVQAAALEVGGLPGKTLAMVEGRRRGGDGNALRAAVLGANDGLVSNLSLVMGVAGAMADERTILLTGIAGLVAGACSMAMGEWLSVSSAREMSVRAVATEANEIASIPEIEREDLVVIYRSKGFDDTTARRLVDGLFRSPADALDALAREELGIDPAEPGGSPWSAAATSFGLFAIGAASPVLPFIALRGWAAFAASFALSILALCAIGGATSLFTGRAPLFSIARQLLIGILAALVTFGIGRLIGVSVA
ncbi:VIT1/CCC1 transporter family protein [Sphingomonas oryzagri]